MRRDQARYLAVAVAGAGLYVMGATRFVKSVRRGPLTMEPWTPERQAEWEAAEVTMRKARARVFADDLREQGLVVAEAPT